jgi:hypothetical protein
VLSDIISCILACFGESFDKHIFNWHELIAHICCGEQCDISGYNTTCSGQVG